MVSQHDREKIDEIMKGYGDWFTARLLRLCQKADAVNLAKIKIGWPGVYALYREWLES